MKIINTDRFGVFVRINNGDWFEFYKETFTYEGSDSIATHYSLSIFNILFKFIDKRGWSKQIKELKEYFKHVKPEIDKSLSRLDENWTNAGQLRVYEVEAKEVFWKTISLI